MRLDAHQHFWRYDAREYPWIPRGSPLERDWLPADLEREQAKVGMEGSIAVQARQSPDESRHLLDFASEHPAIQGVVGWVDLCSERVDQSLSGLVAHPKFVGVRHVLQDEPDDAFMLRPEFLRGIARLKEFDLAYDILIYPKQLPSAIKLVRKFPEQRFVLDHMAKPLIRERALSPWRAHIVELAASKNVWCKVSGLVTEADWNSWKPEDFHPYLDVAFDAFGIDRLMFGSDWPVCLLAGGYKEVYGIVRDYVQELSEDTQKKLFGANCARFYLNKRAPTP
jgi:L-fuconolactonase